MLLLHLVMELLKIWSLCRSNVIILVASRLKVSFFYYQGVASSLLEKVASVVVEEAVELPGAEEEGEVVVGASGVARK